MRIKAVKWIFCKWFYSKNSCKFYDTHAGWDYLRTNIWFFSSNRVLIFCYSCKWSAIASKLPRIIDNEIKNYWHTHLKKRVKDNTPAQKTKPQELQTSISKTKLQILHFDSTGHIMLNAPKSSNSERSLISFPMSPYMSMSDCTPIKQSWSGFWSRWGTEDI